MRLPSGWLLAVAVALFVGAIVAWILSGPHRTVVRERPQETVVVEPPQTPLPRDSGPRNNTRPRAAHASGQVGASGSSTSSEEPKPEVPPRNRPLPTAKRKTTRTKPKRRKAPHAPKQPGQPPQPPPPPPRPPVDIHAPAPVTVCVRPAGGVNCP